MFKITCRRDVHKLNLIHKKRYRPRKELSKLLKVDPLLTGTRTNLTITRKGNFELWQEGKKVGNLHADTVTGILARWDSFVEEHSNEDTGPVEGTGVGGRGTEEWSSTDVVWALNEARAQFDHLQMQYDAGQLKKSERSNEEFCKWPEYVIKEVQK